MGIRLYILIHVNCKQTALKRSVTSVPVTVAFVRDMHKAGYKYIIYFYLFIYLLQRKVACGLQRNVACILQRKVACVTEKSGLCLTNSQKNSPAAGKIVKKIRLRQAK